jgi:hypothetical protein
MNKYNKLGMFNKDISDVTILDLNLGIILGNPVIGRV